MSRENKPQTESQTELSTQIAKIVMYIDETLRHGEKEVRIIDRPYGVSTETPDFEYVTPGVSLDELQVVLAKRGFKVTREENILVVRP